MRSTSARAFDPETSQHLVDAPVGPALADFAREIEERRVAADVVGQEQPPGLTAKRRGTRTSCFRTCGGCRAESRRSPAAPSRAAAAARSTARFEASSDV